MKRLALCLGTTMVVLLFTSPVTAVAGPRKLCYADAHGAVFARATSCAVAETVTEAVAAKYDFSLNPFAVTAAGSRWRCTPYLHGSYHDVICRSRGRAVGVGIKG